MVLKRPLTRIYCVAIVGMCLLANLTMILFRNFLYGVNDGTFAYNLIIFAKGFFWIPYYTCIFIADMVFGETYPDPRFKDKSTIGLSRTEIFFGKFLTEMVVLVGSVLIALAAFLIITPLFQIHDGSIDGAIILDFIKATGMAFPLFVTGTSIANMLLFSFSSKKRAYLAYLLSVIVIPRVVMLLATDRFRIMPFVWLAKLLITPQFYTLQFYATRDVPKVFISSLIYTALSCVIGCYMFTKKEFD